MLDKDLNLNSNLNLNLTIETFYRFLIFCTEKSACDMEATATTLRNVFTKYILFKRIFEVIANCFYRRRCSFAFLKYQFTF